MHASTPTAPKPAKGRPKKSTKFPTWEHPAGSGIRVVESPNKTGGRVFGSSFRVIIPASLTGKDREFSQHKTKAAAFQHAEDRFLSLRRHGQSFTELPGWAQQDALRAWQMLRDAKLDDPKTGGGFVRIAEAAIRVLRPAGGERTFGAVVDELIASKRLRRGQGKLRGATVVDFTRHIGVAREEFGERLIASVTRDDIAAWLHRLTTDGRAGEKLAPTSVLNYRKHVRQVFRYAAARRYTPTNPLAELTREEIEAYGGTKSAVAEVHVLRPEEAARLLVAARDNPRLSMLPAVVLRLFCGLRTEEVLRLDWRDVRWQEPKPYVRLDRETTKTRDLRNVELSANALEWLALCPVKVGPVVGEAPPRKRRKKPATAAGEASPTVPAEAETPRLTASAHCLRFNTLRALAGLTHYRKHGPKKSAQPAAPEDARNWANITRHSFGSYHFALTESADKTRVQMGHSTDKMLFEHYRALVTKADAERYFAIRPGDSQAEPVPFAPVAAVG